MNPLNTVVLLTLLTILQASSLTPKTHQETVRVKEEPECPLNLCFALDGSSSLSQTQYKRQRFLMQRIVNDLPEEKIGLAAVQYGISNILISKLTTDRDAFIARTLASKSAQTVGTFLTAGINFCFSELFATNETLVCGQKKIVVMGDGKGNIGADPVGRARLFEEQGGKVFTVAFGADANVSGLTDIAGGDEKFFSDQGIGLRSLAKKIVQDFFPGLVVTKGRS